MTQAGQDKERNVTSEEQRRGSAEGEKGSEEDGDESGLTSWTYALLTDKITSGLRTGKTL